MTRTFVSLRRISALSVAITAFAASIAAAQGGPEVQPSFLTTPTFARMVEGKTIRITTSDGTRHEGRLIAQTRAGLTVEGGSSTPVPFDRIATVEEVSHRQRNDVLKGTLIGFGSFFGLGALVQWSCWGDECAANLGPAFAFGAIGAGVGAGFGALVARTHRGMGVIYQAPHRTTMSLAPILSPTRKGMAFSMTWR